MAAGILGFWFDLVDFDQVSLKFTHPSRFPKDLSARSGQTLPQTPRLKPHGKRQPTKRASSKKKSSK